MQCIIRIIAIKCVQIMLYTVCSLPRSSDSDLQYIHMSCPRDIIRKTRSSTGSWSANCRGRLGFLFTRTQNSRVCPSSRGRILLFWRGKKDGSDPARGARKLRLHEDKKASLTRLAGSTHELGERVNTVYVSMLARERGLPFHKNISN